MFTPRITRRTILGFVSLLLVALGLISRPTRAQTSTGDLLALINQDRAAQGLHPYVSSVELNSAAQRHSDDMAQTGQISHTGSDGSSSTQRILDAGYGAFPFGLVASENIYGGSGGANAPLDNWMGDAGARANVLNEKYREAGIGVATDDTGRAFWTLVVGAQPNVLPVLIDDGATSVETVTVTLRLFPENVAPAGQDTIIGQPVEYRASTSSRFPGVEWSPWAAQVEFVLDESPGQQTVYVQLRDADERTLISQASVTLVGPEVTVTPTGTLTTPTGTPVTATVTATATRTPVPSRTPRFSPTSSPSATPTPSPSGTPTSAPTATPAPIPTDTPSPTPTGTAAPTATATLSPTPIVPLPTDYYAEEPVETRPLEERLAPWAVGLQIVALVLGVYLALRRPSE